MQNCRISGSTQVLHAWGYCSFSSPALHLFLRQNKPDLQLQLCKYRIKTSTTAYLVIHKQWHNHGLPENPLNSPSNLPLLAVNSMISCLQQKEKNAANTAVRKPSLSGPSRHCMLEHEIRVTRLDTGVPSQPTNVCALVLALRIATDSDAASCEVN